MQEGCIHVRIHAQWKPCERERERGREGEREREREGEREGGREEGREYNIIIIICTIIRYYYKALVFWKCTNSYGAVDH